MRTACLAAALVVALGMTAVPAISRAGNLGLGVIAGDPTGISLKSWLDDSHAVDAAIGWSFAGDESLRLHADYLWHDFSLLRPSGLRGKTPVSFGVGARLQLRSDGGDQDHGSHDDLLGMRFPVGVDWIAPAAPIDVFVEIAPVLDLLPGTDLDVNAALGVRYWFR